MPLGRRRRKQELAEIEAMLRTASRSVHKSEKGVRRISRDLGVPRPRPEPPEQWQADFVVDRHGAEPLIAFVHIPKTAGGTVTAMLRNAYSRTGVRAAGNYLRSAEGTATKIAKHPDEWGKWYRNGGRVVVGHVPFGLFRKHLPPDARYMTFLREPVDRVISHYHRHIHMERRPPKRPGAVERKILDRAEKTRRGKAESLEEAIVELHLPQVNNLATRFLCSDPSPSGELPASALDEAKENLRQFAFVGVQERFEESFVLLQRGLSLDFRPAEDQHVNSDRPEVAGIPSEERALIEEYNRLDLELYAFALALFEDVIGSVDEEFADDVETLRGLSAAANEEYRTALEDAREWLERELPRGTTKPEAGLRAAAETAGISDLLLKRASRLLSVKKSGDDESQGWTRPSDSALTRAQS